MVPRPRNGKKDESPAAAAAIEASLAVVPHSSFVKKSPSQKGSLDSFGMKPSRVQQDMTPAQMDKYFAHGKAFKIAFKKKHGKDNAPGRLLDMLDRFGVAYDARELDKEAAYALVMEHLRPDAKVLDAAALVQEFDEDLETVKGMSGPELKQKLRKLRYGAEEIDMANVDLNQIDDSDLPCNM